MDNNKARQLIAQIVREEIKKMLPTLLAENSRRSTPATPEKKLNEVKRIKTATIKTGNSAIDRILAETNIDSFGDRHFSSEPMVISEGTGEKIGSNIPLPSTDVNGSPMHPIPEAVAKTLDRDFSAILKKSMTFKNGSRPL